MSHNASIPARIGGFFQNLVAEGTETAALAGGNLFGPIGNWMLKLAALAALSWVAIAAVVYFM